MGCADSACGGCSLMVFGGRMELGYRFDAFCKLICRDNCFGLNFQRVLCEPNNSEVWSCIIFQRPNCVRYRLMLVEQPCSARVIQFSIIKNE